MFLLARLFSSENTCKEPVIPNSNLTGTTKGAKSGTNVTVICHEGYTANGKEQTIICSGQRGGLDWSPAKCEGMFILCTCVNDLPKNVLFNNWKFT